jgi:hypothetical protein
MSVSYKWDERNYRGQQAVRIVCARLDVTLPGVERIP